MLGHFADNGVVPNVSLFEDDPNLIEVRLVQRGPSQLIEGDYTN